jgi:hypothetical protein
MNKAQKAAYMREYHIRRKAAGKCVRCNRGRPLAGRIYCQECKEYESAKTAALIRGKKAKIIEHLGGRCIDCDGLYPPEVYQFDHPNGDGDRFDAPSRWIRRMGWDRIKERFERENLELVCANCHVIRTSRRQFKYAPVHSDP